MFKRSYLMPVQCNLILCAVAFFFPACATMTDSQTQVRVQDLENAQLGFLDKYTSGAAPAQWDQASFDGEVAKITQEFANAEAAESNAVPARKEFIKNCAVLFQRDADLVGKKHFLSPSYASNRKKQLQQNYNLFLNQ